MKHIILVFSLFLASLTMASAQREDCQGCGNVGAKYGTNTVNPSAVQLAVFPNPFTEYISLKGDASQINQIIFFSITGKKVRVIESIEENERFYLSDLQDGMYLVQLIGKNGKTLTTQRISKR